MLWIEIRILECTQASGCLGSLGRSGGSGLWGRRSGILWSCAGYPLAGFKGSTRSREQIN